jgi:hypothetical protein
MRLVQLAGHSNSLNLQDLQLRVLLRLRELLSYQEQEGKTRRYFTLLQVVSWAGP